jgi:NAD(P)-dependent dehydrogenase (short-subunit alcohol dehydrogenase family)
MSLKNKVAIVTGGNSGKLCKGCGITGGYYCKL